MADAAILVRTLEARLISSLLFAISVFVYGNYIADVNPRTKLYRSGLNATLQVHFQWML